MIKTPEQVLEEASQTCQESERLIAEALGKVAETDGYFGSQGIERAALGRLREGSLLNDQEKQQFEAELAQWRDEIETEIRQSVEQARGARQASGSPKSGMSRGIRI